MTAAPQRLEMPIAYGYNSPRQHLPDFWRRAGGFDSRCAACMRLCAGTECSIGPPRPKLALMRKVRSLFCLFFVRQRILRPRQVLLNYDWPTVCDRRSHFLNPPKTRCPVSGLNSPGTVQSADGGAVSGWTANHDTRQQARKALRENNTSRVFTVALAMVQRGEHAAASTTEALSETSQPSRLTQMARPTMPARQPRRRPPSDGYGPLRSLNR